MTVYVVVDIGCLECGEDTFIVGIYKDEKVAESKATGTYFDTGQHSVEVFKVEFEP